VQRDAPVIANGGPIATSGDTIVEATSASGKYRGDPAGVVAARGARRWEIVFDATEWALVTSVAGDGGGGAFVGGTFAGTLRAGPKVVATAGQTDGFVARASASGEIMWLVRVGGAGTDAVQGVAFDRERGAVAIAGTFAPGADLLGVTLAAVEERLPFADVFVAELDAATGARRWSETFGGKLDDAVAGVAIDARGRVVVAATVREKLRVGMDDFTVRGPTGALVTWWTPRGVPAGAALLGGEGGAGASAIAAVGERVVIGGFFGGVLQLGPRVLDARGDDAFAVALDARARVIESWHFGGPGREELVALAPLAGGFVAIVAHSAALTIDGAPALAAPNDPLAGVALVVRGVR
jgi:hypothetical protein